MYKKMQMETYFNDEQVQFIEKYSHAVLSICNSRNLIVADFVVFREYDNGGLGMELFKDEHWAKLSMHKQADTRNEFLFFIPRLVYHFYGQGKITI